VTFAEHVRRVRRERGLSQKSAASAIGVSPQYLNDIERARREPPSDAVIERIAAAYEHETVPLYVYAGRLPPPLRDLDPEDAVILASVLDNFAFDLGRHAGPPPPPQTP